MDLFPFALSDALTLVHKAFVPMFDRDLLSVFIPFSVRMCESNETNRKEVMQYESAGGVRG